MSIQGRNVQQLANTAGTGAQASAVFQLGPDVGASMQVELAATATLTLEGRMDPNAAWATLAINPGTANASGQYAITRAMPEMRVNISASTGNVKVWVMA